MFKDMRRSDKAMSREDTLALLIRGEEGVLGTISDNGYPYTTVVNYVFYDNKIYFHCARSGHKLDNIKTNNKVSFTVYDNVEIIGEELNTLYESLVIFGKAEVVDTTYEILTALANKYGSLEKQKLDEMIKKDFAYTAIVEITLEHITGKRGK